jgi:hypothetical protein
MTQINYHIETGTGEVIKGSYLAPVEVALLKDSSLYDARSPGGRVWRAIRATVLTERAIAPGAIRRESFEIDPSSLKYEAQVQFQSRRREFEAIFAPEQQPLIGNSLVSGRWAIYQRLPGASSPEITASVVLAKKAGYTSTFYRQGKVGVLLKEFESPPQSLPTKSTVAN